MTSTLIQHAGGTDDLAATDALSPKYDYRTRLLRSRAPLLFSQLLKCRRRAMTGHYYTSTQTRSVTLRSSAEGEESDR
jgi:hypothetical protein